MKGDKPRCKVKLIITFNVDCRHKIHFRFLVFKYFSSNIVVEEYGAVVCRCRVCLRLNHGLFVFGFRCSVRTRRVFRQLRLLVIYLFIFFFFIFLRLVCDTYLAGEIDRSWVRHKVNSRRFYGGGIWLNFPAIFFLFCCQGVHLRNCEMVRRCTDSTWLLF